MIAGRAQIATTGIVPLVGDILDEWVTEFSLASSIASDMITIWSATESSNSYGTVAMIAATVRWYDLTVISRNVRHLAAAWVKLLNPFWKA